MNQECQCGGTIGHPDYDLCAGAVDPGDGHVSPASAELFIWLDHAHAGWDLVSPDDWYEAMAALMAERGPA